MNKLLHHIPGLEILNSSEQEDFPLQLGILIAGIVMYVVVTMLSCKRSMRNMEKIDL